MNDDHNDQSKFQFTVKDLAESTSTQAKQANKLWIIMITVAFVALFPPTPSNSNTDQIEIPLKIATVPKSDFYPIIFYLYSVLIISFATAHAQTIRAQKLAHIAINKIDNLFWLGIHPRDLFDMLRLSGVSRTAPLAQILRGKYQFFDNSQNCPRYLQIITSWFYLILKIVSSLVFWGFPSLAFYFVMIKAYNAGLSTWLKIFICVDLSACIPFIVSFIASISMIIVAGSDIIWIYQTFKTLILSAKKNKSATS